jgi:hypothetical protein
VLVTRYGTEYLKSNLALILGGIFNVSHFAISYSAKKCKKKMINDKNMKKQFDKINSQFNGLLLKQKSF